MRVCLFVAYLIGATAYLCGYLTAAMLGRSEGRR